MTPDEWRQIEELYHAASKCAPENRAALLAEAEPEIRAKVEAMLAQKDSGEILDRPAAELLDKSVASLPDMIGKTIAHYRVVEKLGEGGMGVVYKARDTHLGRFVALKVLPPEKTADPERKRRFVQEAKSASALNHPNIVTIHDIGSADGIDFIAMEYISGKTLHALVPRRGMRLGEALKIAVQVADALAASHAAKIVHRDLKPGNIMAGDDGRVRVLDFGLAKLTEAGPESDDTRTAMAEGRPPRQASWQHSTQQY